MAPLRFAIIGIGGYAQVYHDAIAPLIAQGSAQLLGVAEYRPELFVEKINALKAKGTLIFQTFDDLMQQLGSQLDVVALPVGIHLHVPLSQQALAAGCHVICEKPVAATVQAVDALMHARDQAGKLVLIGYQEIYSHSIQEIKRRLLEGAFGKILSIKVQGGWPRPQSYYTRNNWAGKLKVQTEWVLDGPANNAMAHYINNMLFIAGPTPASSAQPVSVQAELYRANPIETYDTVALRAQLDCGAVLHFIASHVTETEFHPEMTIRTEQATIIRKFENGATTIQFIDGRVEKVDDQGINTRHEVFRTLVALVQGQPVPYCSLEIARAQTLCINGMHESCPRILPLPASEIYTRTLPPTSPGAKTDSVRVVRGLDQLIKRAYAEEKLFSELNLPWAKVQPAFKLKLYRNFPQNPQLRYL